MHAKYTIYGYESALRETCSMSVFKLLGTKTLKRMNSTLYGETKTLKWMKSIIYEGKYDTSRNVSFQCL